MNHPNRSKRNPGPGANPKPEQIRAARETARLDEREAAMLIHSTETAWRAFEAGERSMHPGLWELFLLKLGLRDAPMIIRDS